MVSAYQKKKGVLAFSVNDSDLLDRGISIANEKTENVIILIA